MTTHSRVTSSLSAGSEAESKVVSARGSKKSMGWKALKSSVFVSQFEGGVVFRGGEAPVVFKGKRAHDLVRALTLLMQRNMTRAEMVAQFPVSAQPVADRLLGDLEQQGMLREREEDDPTPETDSHFRSRNLWNYVADHLARPGEALIRWQGTTFYLAGPAKASLYAVRALAECLAQHIVLLVPKLSPDDSEILDSLRSEFKGLTVEVSPRTASEALADAKLKLDAIWIYSAGDHEFSELDSSLSHAWYFGLLSGHLAISFLDGGVAELLPQWRSRMRPALPHGQTGRLSEQRIALAAAAAAFAAFNRQTGISTFESPSILRVVELNSQITPVTLPDGPSIGLPASSVQEGQLESNASNMEAQIAAAQGLFDAICGILEDETDIELIQVPLSVVPLRVYGHDRTLEPKVVCGWGNTLLEARRRAIQRAVQVHLFSVPAVSRCVLALAVEWSAQLSDSGAVAAATINKLWDEGAGGEALPKEALTDPEVRKLFKILCLMSVSEPMLTVWSSSNPPSARVQVMLEGQVIGAATSWSILAAAYEALGDACMAVQLPGMSVVRDQPITPKACHAKDVSELSVRRVDLGYSGLAEHLFCTVVQGGDS